MGATLVGWDDGATGVPEGVWTDSVKSRVMSAKGRNSSTKFAGGEVYHDNDFAADKRLGLIKLRDARADLANFTADVDGEFQ